MKNETCRYCGEPIRDGESDWGGCCSLECEDAQEDVDRIANLRSHLDTVTAEAKRLSESDDKITGICLDAGFDAERTSDAVAAMAAKLAEVTAERDALQEKHDALAERLRVAPVAFAAIQADAGSLIECGSKSSIESCYGRAANINVIRVRLVRDDVSE